MNASDTSFGNRFHNVERYALFAAAAGLGVCLLCALLLGLRIVLGAYLIAFLFVLGISLGCTALLMIHHLTGGAWGRMIRRVLEAAARTLPLTVLLVIPVLLGVRVLYTWSRPEVLAEDELIAAKSWYLNLPGFLVRTGVYFAVWLVLAAQLNRWALEEERTPSTRLALKCRRLSGPGLVLYGLTMTFAAVDWAMSLEPHWFSTIYGVLFLIGQATTALAFALVVTLMIGRWRGNWAKLPPTTLADLGNLLLAFIMLWAYIQLSQFLIIWSGNLPEEIPWYILRTRGGWGLMGLLLAIFHFFVPFFLLLQAGVKRDPRVLMTLAGFVLVMRVVDLVWTVAPAFSAGGQYGGLWVALLAPAAIVGTGGLWLFFFVRQLRSRSLAPYPEVVGGDVAATAEVAP